MDHDASPLKERWEGGHDDLEGGVDIQKESSRHRSKDRSKSSRRDDKSRHRSKDRERSKASGDKESKELEKERASSRDRRKEGRDDHSKDRTRDKTREKDGELDKYRERDRERDKDRKEHGKEKQREKERESVKDSERGHEKERGRERSKDRDKEKERERESRGKDREREKEKEKLKVKEDREKEIHDREKGRDRVRDKDREVNTGKEKSRERDKTNRKQHDEAHERSKDIATDDKLRSDDNDAHYKVMPNQVAGLHMGEDDIRNRKLNKNADSESGASHTEASVLGERILKMKEERLKKTSEGSSDILSWVNKSRKIEEKRNAEKERALHLSKVFEEQDNINQADSEDEDSALHTSHDLSGVKVLHGLDKVIEGGAVVLTLKDQSILANGDINEDVDMLENVEIGEQKQRDDAYKAAKKKLGTYVDKFNDDLGMEKKMLPQYDDPVADEGITLDAAGRFNDEAKKKLEELRRRIGGVSTANQFEDLDSSAKTSSDYYTHEEMLRFKKPKKKKSLRKKDKLDLDALEAEAVSAGLGTNDLGSRRDGKRQALKEKEEKSNADMRSNAYQSAYARAEEASKALRLEHHTTLRPVEDDDNTVFGDDDDELRKSLERARKLALEKQNEAVPSGPQAIALLSSSTGPSSGTDTVNSVSGEPQENKVVFTEMEEFVWGLQLGEEPHKPESEDVFMEEDEVPEASVEEQKTEDGGWTAMQEIDKDELPSKEKEEDIALDETIHEVAVGKGLSGALNLLKDRGALKESVEWGGRNMDKKKSKLVGIYENDGKKEIRIDRTDEYGRILTPKEAFRIISHKFHGKGPGKMKQEKRMRQFHEELKVKNMKNADTPSLSVERMREAQAQLKTPYLVLSGNVKPGQTSDPRSGFATVEKDLPGGLTPMLGDRKVEHYLGIKRKSEPGNMGPPKRPKSET